MAEKSLRDLKDEDDVVDWHDLMPRGYATVWRSVFESPKFYLKKIPVNYYGPSREKKIKEALQKLELPTRQEWHDWARYPMYREWKYLTDLYENKGYDADQVYEAQAKLRGTFGNIYWDYDEFVADFNQWKKDMNKYLEVSSNLRKKTKKGHIDYEKLSPEEKEELDGSIQDLILDILGKKLKADPGLYGREMRRFGGW